MMRVLFVDDEPAILSGLRRMLHNRRGEWDMRFAEGAEAALRALEEQTTDVVVTDMRMPGMDGADLLRVVRERYPQTVRIILSGHSELAAVLRTVPVAHQFLNKPCEPDELADAIARSRDLHDRLHGPSMRAVVAHIGALPTPPAVIDRLRTALAEPDPDIDDICDIVEKDVAMTAKVLQLSNSAFFGLAHRIGDVRKGILALGVDTVRNLLLAAEAFSSFSFDDRLVGLTLEEFADHGALVGSVARRLSTDPVMGREAALAGLLHDIGLLIMATELPQQLSEVRRRVQAGEGTQLQLEIELMGITHSALGAELLRLWGLPYAIIEPVARHHDADLLPSREMDASHAVFVAEALAVEHEPGWEGTPGQALDPAYLEALNLTDRVAAYREKLAAE
jgi:HD-like signal output (HDOD) protein/CheY-like chemotaxis protein